MPREYGDNDLVQMQNPELPGTMPTTTTYRAFKQVWQPRGFQLTGSDVLAAQDVLGEPVADLDSLTKAQLLEVAATLGVEGVSGSMTKADITEAIRDHQAATEEEA